jgi:hypothetical protein
MRATSAGTNSKRSFAQVPFRTLDEPQTRSPAAPPGYRPARARVPSRSATAQQLGTQMCPSRSSGSALRTGPCRHQTVAPRADLVSSAPVDREVNRFVPRAEDRASSRQVSRTRCQGRGTYRAKRQAGGRLTPLSGVPQTWSAGRAACSQLAGIGQRGPPEIPPIDVTRNAGEIVFSPTRLRGKMPGEADQSVWIKHEPRGDPAAEQGGVMLKGVVSGVALTLAVALVGAYFLVRSGLIPANADAKPGWLETWMARTSLVLTCAHIEPFRLRPNRASGFAA